MKIIDYISNSAVPLIILVIITYGLFDKNKVFDTFLIGAKEGLEIVLHIFPTLVGLFVATGALRTSGIIDLMINIIKPVITMLKIPHEVMPLVLLRPISGSSSIAVATDIMRKYGVDSQVGLIASTIMGATETTIYTISIYTSSVGIKNTRFVLWAALIADFVGIVASIVICNFIIL